MELLADRRSPKVDHEASRLAVPMQSPSAYPSKVQEYLANVSLRIAPRLLMVSDQISENDAAVNVNSGL
jgi:hypothetical protein